MGWLKTWRANRAMDKDLRAVARLVYTESLTHEEYDEKYTLILNNELFWSQPNECWYIETNPPLDIGQTILIWTGRGGAVLETAVIRNQLASNKWGLDFPEKDIK